MSKKILVVSAHPDDETLGCGGALLKHAKKGDELHWAIVTQMEDPESDRDLFDRKSEEIDNVALEYGMAEVDRLGFPATKLDTLALSELIEGIRPVLEKIKPQTVYLPHGGDVHTDHQDVFRAVLSVLKAFRMAQYCTGRILCYETLSSTEAAPPLPQASFLPNVLIDITGFMDEKVQMMERYESEIQEDPMPRGPSAIRALARLRGATIGVEHAEAFMLVREVL